MNECCLRSLDKAVHKSRCTWVCPVCGDDVSLGVILLYECLNSEDNLYDPELVNDNFWDLIGEEEG